MAWANQFTANPESTQDRFQRKFFVEPNSGCHLWEADLFDNGYGKFWLNGKTHKAHRISWELHRGAIPNGLRVLHRCDTPACVNPDHLFVGTLSDNSQDMVAKNRHKRRGPQGERHSKAKLTEAQVHMIRADGRLHRLIAADYGVTPAVISGIKNRRYWRHI